MLAYIYNITVTLCFLHPKTRGGGGGGGGGLGDYSKQLIAAEKCIVESEKLIDRLEKKY